MISFFIMTMKRKIILIIIFTYIIIIFTYIINVFSIVKVNYKASYNYKHCWVINNCHEIILERTFWEECSGVKLQNYFHEANKCVNENNRICDVSFDFDSECVLVSYHQIIASFFTSRKRSNGFTISKCKYGQDCGKPQDLL